MNIYAHLRCYCTFVSYALKTPYSTPTCSSWLYSHIRWRSLPVRNSKNIRKKRRKSVELICLLCFGSTL